MARGTAAFLDTSILIAGLIADPKIKSAIRKRLATFDFPCSGLVARREFKYRFLKDLYYLYRLSLDCDTIQEIARRIEQLPPQQHRKFRICIGTLFTVDENDDDRDRLDRLRLYVLYLLKHGLDDLDRTCTFLDDSGCACGRTSVTEKKGEFVFGPSRCSRSQGACDIGTFLQSTSSSIEAIEKHLAAAPPGNGPGQKSTEILAAESFLRQYKKQGFSNVESSDPCSQVGDLLIALESEKISTFYTKNGKESQHYCKALGQNLIVRPSNPSREEVELRGSYAEWPGF